MVLGSRGFLRPILRYGSILRVQESGALPMGPDGWGGTNFHAGPLFAGEKGWLIGTRDPSRTRPTRSGLPHVSCGPRDRGSANCRLGQDMGFSFKETRVAVDRIRG